MGSQALGVSLAVQRQRAAVTLSQVSIGTVFLYRSPAVGHRGPGQVTQVGPGRWSRSGLDPPDRAAVEVDVVKVAVWPEFQVYGMCDVFCEGFYRARRWCVAAFLHRPYA